MAFAVRVLLCLHNNEPRYLNCNTRVLKLIGVLKGRYQKSRMPSINEDNKIDEVCEEHKTVTLENLRRQFPSLKENDVFDCSGKCSYCNVMINFSSTKQIKIKVENKQGMQKFSIYHKVCYERYLRRTID